MLRTLEYGDLISQGSNNFRYCGIPDDILDLIFRDLYQEEIDQVKPNIAAELTAKVTALEKEKKINNRYYPNLQTISQTSCSVAVRGATARGTAAAPTVTWTRQSATYILVKKDIIPIIYLF